MTTHSQMARVPFAPLDNPRLQHLASAKNHQNGLISKSARSPGKSYFTNMKSTATSPPKRLASSLDSDIDVYDGENVDPAALSSPSKKSKSSDFTFSWTASPVKTISSMPPPTIPSRLSTPMRANMSSSRTPLTAPAGRSPKRKLGAGRRTSVPFTRIDPPAFSKSSSASSLMPFSLDAAISNTLGKATRSTAGSTIQESMPKNWYFDIYEDSPEEEAATLMEHSTLTLDLSSDDEDSAKVRDDRGKENVAPEGYDSPGASRLAAETIVLPAEVKHVKKTDTVRKKVLKADEMDDGQRSPLSDLETEEFFPEGLDKKSHVMVLPTPSKEVKSKGVALFAAPAAFAGGSLAKASSSMRDAPVVTKDGNIKGEIIILEDDSEPCLAHAPASITAMPEKGIADENTPSA